MMGKYQAYPEYKDSGVEWLGAVPEHWQMRRSKFLFNRHKRPVRAKDEIITAFRDGQVTLRKNRRTEGFTNALKEIGYQGVRKGDLIVHAMDGFAGAIGVSDSDGKSSPVYSVLTCHSGQISHTPFYGRLLRNMALSGFITALAKGVRERSTEFRYSEVAELPLPLPPLKEQRTIAAFLNYETARIDRLIEKQQRLIALLKEKRQAVISHAVTKGLDPNVPMKDSGVEWLGEVPEGWSGVRVKQVATFITSGPRGWSDFIADTGEDIFLQSGDLNDHLGLKLETAKKVNPPKGAEGVRTRLHNGDVVVCITGANTGRVAVVKGLQKTTYINQHLSLIRTKPEIIHAPYLALCLSATSGRSYFDIVQYGLKEGLSLSNVCEAPLPLPPLHEQEQIVEYLDTLKSKFDALTDRATQQIELLQERRTALISAAVTGKIDLRGWQPPC